MKVGKVIDFKVDGGNALFLLEEGKALVQSIAENIVRIRATPYEDFAPDRSWAVIPQKQPSPSFEVVTSKDTVILILPGLQARIRLGPFRVTFLDPEGKKVCSESVRSGMGWRKDGSVFCIKDMPEDGVFVGFGEQCGYLNKKGRRIVQWATDEFVHHENQNPLYQAIPYFAVILRDGTSYGILFDNTYKTVFDIGKSDERAFSFEAELGEMNYYFILSRNLKDLSMGLARLTGTMPLPPLWALGHHQSRYSYYPEERVREIASSFRRRRIPCDVIHLDIHYMDGFRNFTFDQSRFPNPKKLISDLANQGFKLVPIVDAGIKVDEGWKVYRDGVKEGVFCRYANGELFVGEVWPGPSVFCDFTSERARKWWGKQLSFYTRLGIFGIWNDMNEPSVFDRPGKTMDLGVLHEDEGLWTSHKKNHNVFGMLMARATYEGLRAHLGNKRPFVLTRSGYAGVQRYAAVWCGDNSSRWDHLQWSIPQLLNLGISGVPFVGVDIGGFSEDSTEELIIRWIQVGAFFPFCRNHSCIGTRDQEPWAFGKRAEDIYRKFVELRYMLLPYLYTLFWEASKFGIPVMRPVLMEFPDDAEIPLLREMDDQFMVGPSIMVAPITRPGQRFRAVYLPGDRDEDWVHLLTGEKFRGGRKHVMDAPIDHIPVLVRPGSLIPTWEVQQYVGEKEIKDLILMDFPNKDGKSSCILYCDSGDGFDYERGEYALIKVSSDKGKLSYELLEGNERWIPRLRLKGHGGKI